MDNGKLAGLLALVAGVALGINWPKIKKFLPKAKEKALELAETAKEAVTDTATKAFPRKSTRGRRVAA